MNELCEIIKNLKDGETLTLENKIYEIAPEDSFHLFGFFFSNTANQQENPEGERFCGIFAENRKNITIDGNGASVMIHGKMTPFIFRNCENVLMKNIAFDHYRPTMTEYEIAESAPGRATLKIHSEFLYRIDGNTIYWKSENNKNGEPYWEIPYKGKGVLTNAFDPVTGTVDDMRCGEGDSRHGFPDITSVEEKEKGLLAVTFRDKNRFIPAGTIAQTRSIKRVQTGGGIDNCRNVTLENLRIKSMNGFGILAQNSRDITYRNLDCTPADGRTVVSDADFFHFSGCSGSVTVTGCRARGAHDDIINIHGTHLRIVELKRESCSAVLRYSHPESWGFNPYIPGDETEFVCGDTLTAYHSAKVLNVKKLTPTDFEVEFDSLPETTPAVNDVIENITRTASMTVENNVFERIPSRAILCTTRKDVVIRNNTFRNMGAPAICVADDANFWFESGRSGTVIFENNNVINCGTRETDKGCDVVRYEPVVMDKSSTVPVHHRLIVRNNHFSNTLCDKYTFNLNYLAEAEITGNEADCLLEIKKDGIVRVNSDL